MDGTAERELARPILRTVEDHGAGGDEYLIADRAASQVGVRAGQHVIPDHEGMPGRSPQHRVLHDHAVSADLYQAGIGAQHRAVQHTASRPHPDLAR